MRSVPATVVAFIGILFISFTLTAQNLNINVNIDDGGDEEEAPAPKTKASVSSSVKGNDFKLNYTTHPGGKTLIKVVEPAGAKGRLLNGATVVKGNTDIPFTATVEGDNFYKVEVFCPGGTWNKSIEAKEGMEARLEVACPVNMTMEMNVNVAEKPAKKQPAPEPAPKASKAMSASQFQSLTAAIDDEGFSDGKLRVIRDAAQGNFFTSEMVGKIIDLLGFDKDKIEAGVICYPKVVDKENFYTVYSHFGFDSSKDELKKKIDKLPK
jgi:hypothetical protein